MSSSPVTIERVKKRNGDVVEFSLERICNAIRKAMEAQEEPDCERKAQQVADLVYKELLKVKRRHKSFVPDVEGIQDEVENQLILQKLSKVSRAYIRYRDQRTRKRKRRLEKLLRVPENVKALFRESKKYFKCDLNEFVYLRTYARWIEAEKRRECWMETVDRYMNFMRENLGEKLTEEEYDEVREGILDQSVMPSMRLMQFAGDAARRSNVCAFNCAFISPTCTKHLADIMYILMQGTGVGFSVQSICVQQFPQIKLQTGKKDAEKYVIPDSTEGWCDAFKYGLDKWYNGEDVEFDYSQLRPAGARLKTKGGKSSGPEPLRELLTFARKLILSKQGKRLSTIEMHDLICYIGLIVVVGGVRRSAMISLSDLDDAAMKKAKSGGDWFPKHPQRAKANNSAVYEKKPSPQELLTEMLNLIDGGSGERGIFNQGSLVDTLPERRVEYLKQCGVIVESLDELDLGKMRVIGFLGGNPCMEIILKSMQFCNLSEVICRPEDIEETLLRKMRLATILGTYQASLTNFEYISKEWKENCDAEALLGVSLTGQWDCPAVRNAETLSKLKNYCNEVNREYAKRFGINPATSTTCVKPSGTVSQTVDSSSGIHRRFAPFYIRRIRASADDDLAKMLKEQGVPWHPENGEDPDAPRTLVFDFPQKAPKEAKFAKDATAIEQLEYWKMVKVHYTEHNPSCTIYVGENEWISVINWIWENWDIVGGISFFPKDESGTIYQLSPYEEITEERYEELMSEFPELDFSQIVAYEKTDSTDVKSQLACSGNVCEFYA